MESWGKWKLIKAGFWLGIGFIIPQLIGSYFGPGLMMLAMPFIADATYDSEDLGAIANAISDTDRTGQIKIRDFREQNIGNQLIILGAIENIGDKNARSIQLEAELMDQDGKFVFECSEYINIELKPGDIENFQIKCGCGSNPVPEHAEVNVRVVSASDY